MPAPHSQRPPETGPVQLGVEHAPENRVRERLQADQQGRKVAQGEAVPTRHRAVGLPDRAVRRYLH